MAFGSYIRFVLGLLMAAEALRLSLAKQGVSSLLLAFAAGYIILSVAWFLFKF